MDLLFKDAYERRRNKEFVLTSRLTNAIYYSSAAWAQKRDIWPPLSSISRINHSINNMDPVRNTGLPQNQPPSDIVTPNYIRCQLQDLNSDLEVLYHPLHDGKTIRILDLHPGRNQPLRCTFRYVNLDYLDQPYEALSYVWGEQISQVYDGEARHPRGIVYTIDCNNQERRITHSLYYALHFMRLPSKPRPLWVDALCINQEDTEERGHQVALMSSVYQNAENILIWIAPKPDTGFHDAETKQWNAPPQELEDARAQRAFGAICDIVNKWRDDKPVYPPAVYSTYIVGNPNREYLQTFESNPPSARNSKHQVAIGRYLQSRHPRWWNLDLSPMSRPAIELDCGMGSGEHTAQPSSPPRDDGINATVEDAPGSQFWKTIAQLFDLPWFWRVWVIQEAVLAQNAIVMWANTAIEWRWIGLAAAILRTNYHAICEKMRMVGVYNAYVMYRMSPMCDLLPPELNFIQLLRLTRQFECTDPRDRVYGLLGIPTSGNDPSAGKLFIEPDYTITQVQLYKRLAWKSIKQLGNLSILSSVQYTAYQLESENPETEVSHGSQHPGPESESALPSWVPHWDSAYRVTLSPWDTADSFSAAKEFPLQLLNAEDIEPNSLRLIGIEIGTVAYNGHFMWHNIDYSMLLSGDLGSFFSSGSGLRLLAQTLTAGRDPYGSLTDSTSEAVANMAAYIVNLHDRYVAAMVQSRQRTNKISSMGDPGPKSSKYDPRKDLSWDDASIPRSTGPLERRNFQRLFNLYPDLETTLRNLAQDGEASRFRETAIPMCERRRLVLTLNGFLGLGPDTVREGDIIAVLSGGDIPFILRPVKTAVTAPDEIGRFLLVGECFVGGIMKGEAVQAATSQCVLNGPVPTDAIIEKILAHGNEPEDIPWLATMCEIERRKMKKERLHQGNVFRPNILEGHITIKPEKRVIEIVDRAEQEKYELSGTEVNEEVYRSIYDIKAPMSRTRNSDSETDSIPST